MTEHPLYRRSFIYGLGALGVGAAANEGVVASDGDGDERRVVTESQTDRTTPYNNELIVLYDTTADLATARAVAMRVLGQEGQQAYVGRVDEDLGLLKLNLSKPVSAADREAVREALAATAVIEHVDVERQATLSAVPNDPYYHRQTNLHYTNVADAWDSRAAADTTIAIVEFFKPEHTHEDLESQYRNPAGIVPNFEPFRDGRGVLHPTPLFDTLTPHEHPTAVSGVAAATYNNQKGIAGASQAQLVSIPCYPDDDDDRLSNLAIGIKVAAKQFGADVINMSCGLLRQNIVRDLVTRFLFSRAVSYAERKGSVVIAAAGNHSPTATSKPVDRPASSPKVIGVSNTYGPLNAGVPDGTISPDSARGSQIDVTAPGRNVWTTGLNNTYKEVDSGTSVSAPLVSGIAALGLSKHPGLTPALLRQRIRQTARPITHNEDHEGAGRIDGWRMVTDPPPVPVTRRRLTATRPPGRGLLTATESIETGVLEESHPFNSPENLLTPTTQQIAER